MRRFASFWVAVAATAAIALPGSGLAAQAVASISAGGQPFKVSSTLDRKSVLPHRIHWIGSTTLPQKQVAFVGFLIDGKTVWFGARIPDSFAGDGGYLVTAWLTPGRHSFTFRVHARDHSVAEDTVIARVLPAVDPPPGLEGTWERTINGTKAPSPVPQPSGTFKIVFDKRWVQTRLPGAFDEATSQKTGRGLILDNDWTPGRSSFHAQGNVIFKSPQRSDRENGQTWCDAGGPGADYTWSVTGNTLTLAPAGGDDACGIRGFIWTGQWTRVG
jgi:hypothetical protein